MKCLSIRQPWAWLIANGHKDIENRGWPTNYRGRVLIHAGKQVDVQSYDHIFAISPKAARALPGYTELIVRQSGGIVGIAEITDCVTHSDSPWFEGPVGFVIANARPLPFVPLKGKLGFFDVPDDICRQLGVTP